MTVWSAYQQDATLRSDLLTETRIAELGIGTRQVTALSGSASEITSPDYRVIEAQLERIRLTTPQARFEYLMGQRPHGTIFFYSDYKSTTSRDYSPNGQDYSEVSTGVKKIFLTSVGITKGPYSDRLGTWVSGIVPVTDPKTGNIIAVFGIVILDLKTHIIDRVNPIAASMFGANPDQIISKKCYQLFCHAMEAA